jgi:hypothetical protein
MAGFNEKSAGALDQVADRLVARYGHDDQQRAALIRTSVTSEAGRFADAPVHAFVPILVERAVRGRLDAPAA